MPFLLPCNQSDAESAVGCWGNNAYHGAAYLEQACLPVRQALELGVMELSHYLKQPHLSPVSTIRVKEPKGKWGRVRGVSPLSQRAREESVLKVSF